MVSTSANTPISDDHVKLFPASNTNKVSDVKENGASVADDVAAKVKDSANSAEDAYKAAEKFVIQNPIPVALGAAAVGAVLVLFISHRSKEQRSVKRKIARELSRYSDEIRQTIKSELHKVDPQAGLTAIARMIPEQDVRRLIGPWIEELTKAFSTAKDGVSKAVKAAAN